jgi:HK97 family phage portal protein
MSTLSDIGSALTRFRNAAPVPFTQRSGSMFSLGGGRDRTGELRAMETSATVFPIIDGIASAGADAWWKLYRKPRPNARTDQLVEVTNSVVLDIWNTPNPFMSQSFLVEGSLQHLSLTGESWWVIARDPRATMPLEIWPVRPDRMTPVPSSTEFIAGYVYATPDGGKIPLTTDQVIFVHRPNPLDIYRGLGIVQSVIVDMDAARYTAEWNLNFFKNSAEPGGLIEFEKRLSDAEWRQVVQRWREQHQGVDNAHRVGIIEAGKWVPNAHSMKDMDFRGLREVNAEIIRRAFRYPSAMLGDSGDVNRATAQAHEYMTGKHIIVPSLKRLHGGLTQLTAMFYPGGSPDVEWHFGGVIPDDEEAENAERTSKASAWSTFVGAGADPAWAAEVCDLPVPRMASRPEPAPLPAAVRRAEPTTTSPTPVRSCPSCGMEAIGS